MQKHTFRAIALNLSVAVLTVGAVAQTSVAATSATSLESGYSLTKTGWGSADRITRPGTIYVIHTDGLLARAIADHITPTNTIAKGQLIPPARGFRGAFGTSGDTEQVKPGQRFYIHQIETKEDGVVFTLLSLNTVPTVANGASTRSRVRLYLKFELPANDLAKLTPAALHELTDPVFLPEGSPAPLPTVHLGQSMADVCRIMGQPEKEVDLGSKKILVYPDLKVTLVEDKVTDAE